MLSATHRTLFASLLAIGLATFLAACGDDSSTNPPPGNFNGTISVRSNSFSPNNVTIDLGDSVTWHWDGGTHTVTSGTAGSASAGSLFDSPSKSSGTFGFRFNSAGTVNYFCRVHGAMMSGTVVVKP